MGIPTYTLICAPKSHVTIYIIIVITHVKMIVIHIVRYVN